MSVKRVGAFLKSEELDPDIVERKDQPAMGEGEGQRVCVR